ncbi:MAG: fibronectin type III domain-containing protein [Terriglobales bacterium]
MNRKLAIALVTLAISAWAVAQMAQTEQITSGPTVEAVTGNSATIAWSTNVGGSSIVKYGTDANNLNQTAQSPYAETGGTHRVQLKNLKAGTTYYYQVLSGQAQGTGGMAMGQVGQFTTPGGAFGQESATRIPLYRAAGPNGSHLFTTDFSQLQSAASQGFRQEGIAGYVDKNQGQGELPLYHLAGTNGDNFYTTNAAERDNAISRLGFRDAGIAGYVASSPMGGTQPLYRLYNPGVQQHFYTTNAGERAQLLSQGWQDNGVAGYVWAH